jgi:hypothetical protein
VPQGQGPETRSLARAAKRIWAGPGLVKGQGYARVSAGICSCACCFSIAGLPSPSKGILSPADRRQRHPLGRPPAARCLRRRERLRRRGHRFRGRQRRPNPLLRHAERGRQALGPFLYYVLDLKLLGGSVGIGTLFPTGNQCGRIFSGESTQCQKGFGDPYVEIDWSRSFGTVRPSKYAGAYPIRQGLSVLVGFGVVFPAGTYDDTTRTNLGFRAGPWRQKRWRSCSVRS